MNGQLICRSGELAGSRFELGAETTIGRDSKKQSVTADGGKALVQRYARIFIRDGQYFIENVGAAGSVRVDGVEITAPALLERMHVIGLPEGIEFVFSRAAAAAASAPAAGAQAEQTVVDMLGFGALPELKRGAGTPPPVASAPTHQPPPAPAAGPDAGHTVVDMVGFGALPELVRAKPASRSTPPAPSAAPPPPALPAAEVTVPMAAAKAPATEYVLVVNLPNRGAMTVPLRAGDNTIGRGSDADIVIDDPEMWLSRKHAIVRVRADGIELVDLKGRNGTFVNGQRIDTARLTPGATFILGPHLEFRLQKR